MTNFNPNSVPANTHSAIPTFPGTNTPDYRKNPNNPHLIPQSIQEVIDNFDTTYPELLKFLETNPTNSNFINSIYKQLLTRGNLSEKQISTAIKISKIATDTTKEPSHISDPNYLFPNIRAIFDNAISAQSARMSNLPSTAEMKSPILRTEDYTFRVASPRSRYAGAIFVSTSDPYPDAKLLARIGHAINRELIVPNQYATIRSFVTTILPELRKIEANPLDAAVRYGQLTGKCSCCGRTLTNHESIEAGIGPICAEKWGM